MSDVNRDPIRWERSMTQDKDGQYVAYHDYAVLLESHDALRAEVERLQKDDATLRDAVMRLGEIAERRGSEVERLRAFVREVNEAPAVEYVVGQYADGTPTTVELIARPRRMEV